MQEKKFEWQLGGKRDPKELKLSALLELFDEVPINKRYMNMLKQFDYLHQPFIIDENDYVHSGPAQLKHLLESGCKEVQTIVVRGIENEVDAAQLTDFTSFYSLKSFRDIATVTDYLTNLLTSTSEGKEWAEQIEGEHTRAKISTLLGGMSEGKIGMSKVLNEAEPELIRLAGGDQAPFTQIYNVVKDAKRKANVNVNIKPSTEQAKKLKELVIQFENEEYSVAFDDVDYEVRNPDGSRYTGILLPLAKKRQGGDVEHSYGFDLNANEHLLISFIQKKSAA